MAGLRAVADAGGALLEVTGRVVMRRVRRFSDFANHPDPLVDIHRCTVRLHTAAASEIWEEVEGLSLGRSTILILIPIDDSDPGSSTLLHVPSQQIRAKLVCGGLQVTGFVQVPFQATVASFIRESRLPFLAVTSARVTALPGISFEDFDSFLPFCLVNRNRITACIETRAEGTPSPPPQE